MWFDKLTTNGFKKLPFVLSPSKDLIRASLIHYQKPFAEFGAFLCRIPDRMAQESP